MKYGIKVILQIKPSVDLANSWHQTSRGWESWCNTGRHTDGRLKVDGYLERDINVAHKRASLLNTPKDSHKYYIVEEYNEYYELLQEKVKLIDAAIEELNLVAKITI